MKNCKAFFKILVTGFLFFLTHQFIYAQQKGVALTFTVTMPHPETQQYHVTFKCEGIKKDSIEFKMPAWMPGYYQLLNYAGNVENFTVVNGDGNVLAWQKNSDNGWMVRSAKSAVLVISYDVKATVSFVAANYIDEEHGYIAPTGLFLYPTGYIHQPVTVNIQPCSKWTTVATGLEPVVNKRHTFTASDYDVLFDAPILMGNLETFPSFTIKNIPHDFIAFKPDSFNRNIFMNDLKKIITVASGIIGDIPYKHYTFLGTGPGGGGIEHLNSASVAFTGKELNDGNRKIGTYNFLAHEYFHHYNVKRIRPIELGPFDYDKGSKTKMLWLSEGITVYYEYIILKRAGFTIQQDVLNTFGASIKEYESKPGRNFQTPAEASYATWEDGPFGRTGDEVNKTISPYDKGPLLGMLLDFKIRHETKNKKSLDDVMRLLYNKYYKTKGRGFTETEFKNECEKTAGSSLTDFFDYIYTLKTVDYPTYLGYAGLTIDTATHILPGAWSGAGVRDRNDTLWSTNVEYQSPAWQAGLRNRKAILKVNGNKMNATAFNELLASSKSGDSIKILFSTSSGTKEEEMILATKKERSYAITPVTKPGALQTAILKSWLGESQ
ncbi:M61 family metallopeptidase [Ferruginibacter profundus]